MLIVHREKMVYPVELVEALFHNEEHVKWAASSCLGLAQRLPPESLPLLMAALEHEDVDIRSAAATATRYVEGGAKKALPLLKKALRDDNPSVRNNAALAVWDICQRADLVIPTLLALCCDEDWPREFYAPGTIVAIELMATEKPDEVCSAVIDGLRNERSKIRDDAGYVLVCILKTANPKLKSKCKELRKTLTDMARDPNEDDEASISAGLILRFVDRPETDD